MIPSGIDHTRELAGLWMSRAGGYVSDSVKIVRHKPVFQLLALFEPQLTQLKVYACTDARRPCTSMHVGQDRAGTNLNPAFGGL